MTEPLWIYTTSRKLKLCQELAQKYPQAKITESESMIVVQSQKNVVIILSQLSQENQLELNTENSYFYMGVRVQITTFKSFETVYELEQQLRERQERHLFHIQRQYIQLLKPLSEKDIQYLKRLIENFDEIYDELDETKSRKSKFSLNFRRRTPSVKYKHYKGIIAVYNSPQFAIRLAESLKVKSLLLMEGNLLRPTLDDYLNISKIETNVESHITGIDNTGLNIALDSLRKQTQIKHDLKHIVKKHHHYDVLLGNYNVLNYEHYDPTALGALMDTMTHLYGCIIISLGDNLYDYMTLMCLNRSDVNIICLDDTKNSVLWTKQMIETLKTKQFIEPEKHYIYKIRETVRPQRYSKAVLTSIFEKQYKGTVNLNQKSSFKKVVKEITR